MVKYSGEIIIRKIINCNNILVLKVIGITY
jgi:hypothetical protein